MTSEFLPVYRDNLREMLEEFVPSVTKRHPAFTVLCEYSECYRAVGIADLLIDANAEAFLENLVKAGQLFLAGLPRVPRGTALASRATALFDSLACGDLTTARAIADLLPVASNPNLEYEEDFWYMQFVIRCFLRQAPRDECEAAISAMQKALDGAPEPRADLALALFEADQRNFDTALDDFLAGYEARYKRLVDNGRLSEEMECTLPYVSVEAVALLRLADSVGLATKQEYRLVPSLVRAAPTPTIAQDAWKRP